MAVQRYRLHDRPSVLQSAVRAGRGTGNPSAGAAPGTRTYPHWHPYARRAFMSTWAGDVDGGVALTTLQCYHDTQIRANRRGAALDVTKIRSWKCLNSKSTCI